jgi:hypothetical protein
MLPACSGMDTFKRAYEAAQPRTDVKKVEIRKNAGGIN